MQTDTEVAQALEHARERVRAGAGVGETAQLNVHYELSSTGLSAELTREGSVVAEQVAIATRGQTDETAYWKPIKDILLHPPAPAAGACARRTCQQRLQLERRDLAWAPRHRPCEARGPPSRHRRARPPSTTPRPGRPRLGSPREVAQYLLPHHGGYAVEKFGIVSLNTKHRVLRTVLSG